MTLAVHEYFDLDRHPFPPTPDPTAYYYAQGREQEITEIEHCFDARKGIMLVTGEVGLGKSTLLRRLLEVRSHADTTFALVFNTFLQEHELLAAICADFGLESAGRIDADINQLNAFLIEESRAGRNCVLLIDDAQNLSAASLELVRLLSNLETAQHKLLQIVLCGQPELETTLAEDGLRQLRDRVVKRLRLEPLTLAETPRYVEFRINAAGGGGRLTVGRDAARVLHRVTGGNLRRLHQVLDRCLYGLIGRRSAVIDASLVRDAAVDLGLVTRDRRLPLAAAALVLAVLLGVLGLRSANDPGPTITAWLQPAFAAVTEPFAADAGSLVSSARQARASVAPTPRASKNADLEAAAEIASNHAATDEPQCLQRLRARHGASDVRLQPLPDSLAQFAHASGPVCSHRMLGQRWLALPVKPPVRQGARIRNAQRHLAGLGLLSPDGIDGLMGPVTEAAIRRFQRDRGLPVTSEADALTVMALRVFSDAAGARETGTREDR